VLCVCLCVCVCLLGSFACLLVLFHRFVILNFIIVFLNFHRRLLSLLFMYLSIEHTQLKYLIRNLWLLFRRNIFLS